MSSFKVESTLREETGRGAARRLRREDKIPAIVYGGNQPELSISLERFSLRKLLNEETFFTALLTVNIEGKGDHTALLRDVQWDPITDEPLHLDFHRVNASDIVHADVPLHTVGTDTCPGAALGGTIAVIRHVLTVRCRADIIPEFIAVDCSQLTVGDNIHVEDLRLPEGVEAPHDVNFTILNFVAQRTAEEEETTVAAGATEEAAE
ncbi:MAG: 50S ribosomal protein L25/general stress protein Ctc [Mariprofundaceae bacterium]|nr:50S ribosomal protein L25/general stress protein Ctc [Mariprofundaceae bacterium]